MFKSVHLNLKQFSNWIVFESQRNVRLQLNNCPHIFNQNQVNYNWCYTLLTQHNNFHPTQWGMHQNINVFTETFLLETFWNWKSGLILFNSSNVNSTSNWKPASSAMAFEKSDVKRVSVILNPNAAANRVLVGERQLHPISISFNIHFSPRLKQSCAQCNATVLSIHR